MEEHDYYNKYLEDLKKIYGKPNASFQEQHGRTYLQNLLEKIALNIDKELVVIHEEIERDESDQNSKKIIIPDFKIERTIAIVGYIENKRPNSDLDEVIGSEQIKRYQTLSKNIMLTNYHKWIWLKDDNPPQEVQLFDLDDLKNSHFRLDPEKVKELHQILYHFLKVKPEPIADAGKLAEALAIRTRYLNEFMEESLQQHATGKLQGLYKIFKNRLYSQLEIKDFADTYAQMLAYGLFLARLNNKTAEEITLENAERFIPAQFELMQELVGFLRELRKKRYEEIKWVVEEILFIINTMGREAIADSLSFTKRTKNKSKNVNSIEDPFVNFYEIFLKAYNTKLRKSRGVYYTPLPIVNFITRSLDDILKDIFEIPTGFADHQEVTILDFACGTGTFMLEIFEHILNSIGAKTALDGKAPLVVKEHLLKNIYGFEFLIAAYAIAHLKLWQYLTDKNYEFGEGERLQILLANTLEPSREQKEEEEKQIEIENFAEALSAESELGEKVKDKKILVITGNPPYSAYSQNPSEIGGQLTWIGKKIEDYKKIDGIRIKERMIGWIQDDYVKFIRYAQYKMEEVDEGVVGIITNHAFIDNPTFRGMRKSLMDSFDQIYIIDLHGNARRSEEAKDGGKDENVFDIRQGVAISFFIKKKGLKRGVFHFDKLGTRIKKYEWAFETNFDDVNWKKITPSADDYLFVPENNELKPEYREGWSVCDIFHINSVGITTARDHLTIQFTPEKIKETVENLLRVSFAEAKKIFKVTEKKYEWKVKTALEDLKEKGYSDSLIKPIQFRIFDTRFTYHTRKANGFVFRPRNKIMDNMLKDNVALITVRQLAATGSWLHVGVTKDIAECCVISNKTKEINYLFPLYLYTGKESTELTLSKNKREENFQQEFRNFINKKYTPPFLAEEIMAYIYAVLHSPIYRSRYHEFLCKDFPRIPFCKNKKDFEQLAKVGQELIDLHLLNGNQPNINLWQGKGNFKIDEINYNEKTESLYINKDKYLHPITKEVWNFQIGGYQVLNQYLKYRKGRDITSEANHVERIVDIIQNTMKAMETLDSLTPQAFPHWYK